MIRISKSGVAVTAAWLALASAGLGWSHYSDALLESEVRAIAGHETNRTRPTPPADGAWRVICEGSGCRAETEADGARISAQVGANDGRQGLMFTVTTPIGVQVARGVEIATDNGVSATAAFYDCLPTGCNVRFYPEMLLMIAFRQSAEITVRYYRAAPGLGMDGPGTRVETRVSLHRFVPAIAGLR